MPYGIPKAKGGDSPANVKRMKACVDDVMRGGHRKDHAVAICKVSLGFVDRERKSS